MSLGKCGVFQWCNCIIVLRYLKQKGLCSNSIPVSVFVLQLRSS